MEGQDKSTKEAKGDQDKATVQEVKEQNINEPNDRPSTQKGQGSCTTPMEGKIRDDNTRKQETNGDAEMTPREVGTEDPYLRDLVEKEGIDLTNILEQWKK